MNRVVVNRQTATVIEYDKIVSDAINYQEIFFEFDESWDNLDKHYQFSKDGVTVEVVNTEEKTFIPHEVITTGGTLQLVVYGERTDGEKILERATTQPVYFNIVETPINDNPDNEGEVTPSVVDQITGIATNAEIIAKNAEEVAQSVRYDADVGKFDGKDGTNGKDGTINGQNVINIVAGTNVTIDQEGDILTINAEGGGTGGTTDYTQLTNKPQVNSVELGGNKTLEELGIQPSGNYLTGESDPTVPYHVKGITEQDIIDWNNKSEFSGDYNDLNNKPSIPTKTSDLTNDSNFVVDENYVHTDNNFTSSEQTKLNELANVKSIGENLELTAEGVLNATGGGGSETAQPRKWALFEEKTLDATGASTNISNATYNSGIELSNGTALLKAGKTYRISIMVKAIGFSSASNGALCMWIVPRGKTTGEYAICGVQAYPPNINYNYCAEPNDVKTYTPTEDTEIVIYFPQTNNVIDIGGGYKIIVEDVTFDAVVVSDSKPRALFKENFLGATGERGNISNAVYNTGIEFQNGTVLLKAGKTYRVESFYKAVQFESATNGQIGAWLIDRNSTTESDAVCTTQVYANNLSSNWVDERYDMNIVTPSTDIELTVYMAYVNACSQVHVHKIYIEEL